MMSPIINANTRLNKALDLHPQVLDYMSPLSRMIFSACTTRSCGASCPRA